MLSVSGNKERDKGRILCDCSKVTIRAVITQLRSLARRLNWSHWPLAAAYAKKRVIALLPRRPSPSEDKSKKERGRARTFLADKRSRSIRIVPADLNNETRRSTHKRDKRRVNGATFSGALSVEFLQDSAFAIVRRRIAVPSLFFILSIVKIVRLS